ncbi:hypothetical protein Gogos_020940, partial [Gossypium gossypioides]|nr:hypothetical protein [Gossypium gossypioides]
VKRSIEGKRFGFVRFAKLVDAQRAISRLDGFVILGKKIWVKMARFSGKRKIWKKVQAKKDLSQKEEMQSRGMEYQEEERDESNGNLLDGRLKSVEVEKIGMNKMKVVEGQVQNEQLWNLQRCLVGETAYFCNSNSLSERIARLGLEELIVKSIQGRYFLIEILKKRGWAYLKEFFINIEPWSEKFKVKEKASWIEVSGIPVHCWNYQTFKRVAGLWGEIIAMGENMTMANNFEKMDILILIKQAYNLEEVIMLEVGNDLFPIRIKEKGSTNKSEIKLSPEGRRNDGDEGVIEPCLENERNDNGVQGISVEAFNVENNSFSNVMSLLEEGEANVDLSDGGLEDFNFYD